MNRSNTVLNSISWRDLCPWLILFKSVGIALRPSIVGIAFFGLLVTPIGWSAAGLFLAEGDKVGDALPLEQQDNWIQIREQIQPMAFWEDSFQVDNWFTGQGPLQVFGKFYTGHLQILNPMLNLRQCTYFALGSIWMLLVWSVLGAMICRIAATHFTRDERTDLFEAFGFVKQRLFSIWTASFVPLILIILFAIPFFAVGLMMKANFLLMLIGVGWFLVALLGLVMAIILIPLFFGYPLLWPAIATEGSDAFESVSRSYSYPTQKPFHYVFYWVVILMIGFLAAFVASTLATKTIEFTRWGTSWGAGTERIREIDGKILSLSQEDTSPVEDPTPSDDSTPSDQEVDEESFTMLGAGASTINFWEQGIVIVSIGFNYGFFFVTMTGMYLLLRKDSDFSELDEIHIDPPKEVLPLPEIQSAEPELPKPLVEPPSSPTAPEAPSNENSASEAKEATEAKQAMEASDEKRTTAPADEATTAKGNDQQDNDDDGELRVEDE